MVVYGDVVFAVNAAINYILLRIGAKLCGWSLRRWRAAVAAAFGGVYAFSVLLPPLRFLASFWGKAAAFAAMILIAYGARRGVLRPAALFLLGSMALAGCILLCSRALGVGMVPMDGGAYYPLSARVLVLFSGVFYLGASLLLAGSIRHGSREMVKTELTACGRSTVFQSLRDTGSTITDPMTGRPVIVIAPQAGAALLGVPLEEALLRDPTRAAAYLAEKLPNTRPRLVPYRAVGITSGMLLAVACTAKLGNAGERQVLAAISPTPVSDGGGYEGLIGGTLL